MKKIIPLFIALVSLTSTLAQVGIGTTNIGNGVQLQIESNSKGLLIPRVALTSTTVEAPVGPSPIATGVLIYNTATNGSDGTAVTPGFYYWTGTIWTSLKTTSGQNWSLSGNSGTTGTNYLGTSDNTNLQIKTNNALRMTVENDGQVIVGSNTTPLASTLMSVYPATGQVGLFVSSTNSQRTIRALSASNSQFVIDGGNLDATGGNGVIGISANPVANTSSTVVGVRGVAGRTTFTELAGEAVGVAASGTTGLHVRGVGKNTTVDFNAAYFEYDEDDDLNTSSGPFARIAGKDVNYFTAGGTAAKRDVVYGGYFDANTSATDYVFVGAKNNGTSYKVLGGGSVSTMIEDKEGNNRILHATETPEILFEDFGMGKLQNGEARITLDPLLSDHIFVDEKHPMKVFIQLEGDCNGVYVTLKSREGFAVKELKNGKSNVPFSWNIVANRADEKDVNGTIASKHVDVRFPIGPKRLEQAKQKEAKYDIEMK